MHEEVTAAIAAAKAAGEVAMRYYRGGFEVTIKPDQTPVTQADREAEHAIRRVLGRAFPNDGFLGEEFGEEGSRERRWIIDPIDGTKNFIRRIPIWAVLIGLEVAGEVTAGVVFNPASGELLWARKGDGAWAGDERLRVSECRAMKRGVPAALGSPPAPQGRLLGPVPRLIDATARTRGFGDYYGYGLVAAGKAEHLPGDGSQALGRRADEDPGRGGGRPAHRLLGPPSIYNGSVLATNGHLHEAALRALAG